jgi:hypothetical protein
MKPVEAASDAKTEKPGSSNGFIKNSSIPAIMVSVAKSHKKMWDAGTLLQDSQKEALATLAEYISIRPLPVEEWRHDETAGIEPANDTPQEAVAGPGESESDVSLIYKVLAEAEASANDDDIDDVLSQQKRLKGILNLCDNILSKLSLVDESLIFLQDQHDSVVSKTSAVHTECEKLTAEKTELEGLEKVIQSRLAHYNELENFQRQLMSLNMQVISDKLLLSMITFFILSMQPHTIVDRSYRDFDIDSRSKCTPYARSTGFQSCISAFVDKDR